MDENICIASYGDMVKFKHCDSPDTKWEYVKEVDRIFNSTFIFKTLDFIVLTFVILYYHFNLILCQILCCLRGYFLKQTIFFFSGRISFHCCTKVAFYFAVKIIKVYFLLIYYICLLLPMVSKNSFCYQTYLFGHKKRSVVGIATCLFVSSELFPPRRLYYWHQGFTFFSICIQLLVVFIPINKSLPMKTLFHLGTIFFHLGTIVFHLGTIFCSAPALLQMCISLFSRVTVTY